MIIRSQDKRMIINFNSVDTLKVKVVRFRELEECIKYQISYYGCGEYDAYIASYSTVEKAIKVLDMIESLYAKCEALKALSSGTMVEVAKLLNKEQAEEFANIYSTKFIFQMPQDSEV